MENRGPEDADLSSKNNEHEHFSVLYITNISLFVVPSTDAYPQLHPSLHLHPPRIPFRPPHSVDVWCNSAPPATARHPSASRCTLSLSRRLRFSTIFSSKMRLSDSLDWTESASSQSLGNLNGNIYCPPQWNLPGVLHHQEQTPAFNGFLHHLDKVLQILAGDFMGGIVAATRLP